MALIGSDLTGDQASVILDAKRWGASGVVADATWAIAATSNRVTMTAQPRVNFTDRSEPMVPGIYSVAVRATRNRVLSDGTSKQLEQTSNEIPLVITARLDGPDLLVPGSGAVTVQGYGFQHPDGSSGTVQVFVGPDELAGGTAGALNPGEYAVVSNLSSPPDPGDPQTLEVMLPTGLIPGQTYPLRVFVNGVESRPKWVRVP